MFMLPIFGDLAAFQTLQQLMISTKLKKQAQTRNLLIEFSSQELHPIIQKFYFNCKQEGVLLRRSPSLQYHQLNFHLVQIQQSIEVQSIQLQNVPREFSFVISLFYMTTQDQQAKIQAVTPKERTILLREGLDTKFFIDYQFQNTQSENQSLIFLCEFSAQIINSRFCQDISFYDQLSSEIKVKSQNQNPVSKLWNNILFQIPGMGPDKCMAVSQKYPCYQSILSDFNEAQQLQNVVVKRGLKQSRLGEILANRIYKCLLAKQYDENVLQRKVC